MSVKVFHHDDMDGRCGGFIARRAFPEAKCYEVNYNDPLPLDVIEPDDSVYIIDYTPSTDELFEEIVNRCKKLVWIDHHGKNIAKHAFYNKCLDGLRCQKDPSGAMLAWQYFFPKKRIPTFVRYVSDYDCWKFDYGMHTKSFEAGLKCLQHGPHDPIWDKLLEEPEIHLQNVLKSGFVILNYQNQTYHDIILKGAFTCQLDGLKVLACNIPGVGSNLFRGVDTTDFPVVSTFYTTGEDIIVGLYSENEEIDCCALAQKYGGGGHKGAAGFQCKFLPFTDIKRYNG